MFTMNRPRIYRLLEYAVLVMTIILIWQNLSPSPSSAQDETAPDTLRNIIKRNYAMTVEVGAPLIVLVFDTPVLDRSEIIPSPDTFAISAIGDDYICIRDMATFDERQATYCTPLANISRIKTIPY